MTDKELLELLRTRESDRVEIKPSLSDREEIRQAICAFANDLPGHRKTGVVLVGLRDDGSCAGFPITDKAIRTLADMRSDGNILPPPLLAVEKKDVAGCEVAVVTVEPSDSPPIRLRGRVWIRVGSRRGTASPEEERRLVERARSRVVPFDIRALPEAPLSDLDIELAGRIYLPAAVAPDVLEENRRTKIEQLASLRIATLEGTPTVLGVLLFANDPLSYLPGAYVQLVRFDGADLAAPIRDEKRLAGPLHQVLNDLDEILRLNISAVVDPVSQPLERRLSDYPIQALVEIARNAILHRTYEWSNAPASIYWFDDRVEIHSPGGPFGRVTPENFGQPGITDYRNPHLAEAMKLLGYIQKFGTGIERARAHLERNGNPPPEFLATQTNLAVIIRRRS